MKKTLKIVLYLLIAVPIIFIGCQKSELNNDIATNSVKSEQVILPYTACGNQLVANLYEYGNTGDSYGTLTVGNDLVNLYITFEASVGFKDTYLYVGTAEGIASFATLYGDGTGYFHLEKDGVSLFPYRVAPNGSLSFTYVIPLSSLPDCFTIVAFAVLEPAITGGSTIVVSAKVPTAYKSLGYYLDYCKQKCTAPSCETAYAFGGDPNDCFLLIPGINSNNWGWSNGPIGAGTYDWPIYAGAGQCDITKGTLVGTLHVVYSGSTATITYNMNAGKHLNVTQLWVGNQILPKKNNKWTTAPGQFPYKHENLNGAGSDTYTITGLSGNIYIAAHSEVCW